ncbi:MAG: hypothetical protein KAS71_05895 [Bacteroidales bacterium]|nr:hypothetical protein [Bacteroidales bacterium]
MIRTLAILGMLIAFLNLKGQVGNTTQDSISSDTANNYIINYLSYTDVGFLWSGQLSQDERLGFIGEDFERIQIHFNSIIHNYDNPYEYLVYGKSMVKNSVCEFQGSIIIYEVGFESGSTDSSIRLGFINGDFLFYENKSCLHSGIFQGEFRTNFYLDKTETLYYDDIDSEEYTFINNSFTGKWFHYDSDLEQVCNWGDKRIPESSGLDIGLEKFKPSFQYFKSGWEDYNKEKEQDTVESVPWWK